MSVYSDIPRWRVFLREQEDQMRKLRLALIGMVALSLIAITTVAAQQNDNANRKKPPKQTHDTGIDDPEPAPATTIGEHNVDGVTIVDRGNGVLMGLLDESFQDALVASVNPDGSVTYRCLHGLPAAAKHVASSPPPVSAAPKLEEK